MAAHFIGIIVQSHVQGGHGRVFGYKTIDEMAWYHIRNFNSRRFNNHLAMARILALLTFRLPINPTQWENHRSVVVAKL